MEKQVESPITDTDFISIVDGYSGVFSWYHLQLSVHAELVEA